MLTPDYKENDKLQLLNELSSFTSSENNFEVRMMAFNYLQNLDAFNEEVLLNLKQASTHYNWQLKKFSRNMLELLESNPKYKTILKKL
mgnify:CR=1 FL=1